MPQWLELIGVPLVGAIAGFIVWYLQSRIESIRNEQAKLHDERRALYSAILAPYIKIMVAIKTGDDTSLITQEILSYDYRKASFEFTLVAPDEVVRAYNDLMQFFYHANDDGPVKPEDMLRHWGAFMLALRRNLGNSKTRLNEIDMLRSWITDIDRMFSK